MQIVAQFGISLQLNQPIFIEVFCHPLTVQRLNGKTLWGRARPLENAAISDVIARQLGLKTETHSQIEALLSVG